MGLAVKIRSSSVYLSGWNLQGNGLRPWCDLSFTPFRGSRGSYWCFLEIHFYMIQFKLTSMLIWNNNFPPKLDEGLSSNGQKSRILLLQEFKSFIFQLSAQS